MRIGVISDTHVPDRADSLPEKLLQALKSVDMILHAGDLAEVNVLNALRGICAEVKAVYGNMDPQEVRNVLPEKDIIRINGKKIGLVHGYGHPNKIIENVTSVFKNDKVNAIVFGHSHNPINEIKSGVLYFNPGSPTDRIFSIYNSYGILEVSEEKIEGKIIRL